MVHRLTETTALYIDTYMQHTYYDMYMYTGFSLDILKMESWTHMGRTANIIIKDVSHVFASISKIMRILLMGRRNCERCVYIYIYTYTNISYKDID